MAEFPTTLRAAQYSRPDALNPRIAIPIDELNTTITLTAELLDGVGAPLTGDFLAGIQAQGYTETIYVPPGGASGTTWTGCVRGVRLAGLVYTTGVPALAIPHNQDSSVFLNVSAIHWDLIRAAFSGAISTGGNDFSVGDGTASDISFVADNNMTIKPKIYWDNTDQRWKLTWGDAAPASGVIDGLGIPVLTTAERDARNWPSNGPVIYNTTTGTFQGRNGGAWTDFAAGATPNATTLVSGKTQLTTVADQIAHTAIGTSGASLVIPNGNFITVSAGAADAGKPAVTDATGKWDSSLIPNTDGFSQFTLGETVVIGDALRIKKDGKAYLCSKVPDFMRDQLGLVRLDAGAFSGNSVGSTVSDASVFMYLIDTDKWMFVWTASTILTNAKIGTLSGGVWTFGATVDITNAAAGTISRENQIGFIDNASPYTKFAFVYDQAGGGGVYMNICTISGVTITVGVATIVQAARSGATVTGTDFTGTQTAIITYQSAGAIIARGLTISGTTPTFGAEVTVDSTGSLSNANIIKIDNLKTLVVYSNATSFTIRGAVVTQTDNTSTIAVNASVVLFSAIAVVPVATQLIFDATDKGVCLFVDNDDSTWKSFVITVSGTVPTGNATTQLRRTITANEFDSQARSENFAMFIRKQASGEWLVINGMARQNFESIYGSFVAPALGINNPSIFTQFGYLTVGATTVSPTQWDPMRWYGSAKTIYWESGDEATPYIITGDPERIYYQSSVFFGNVVTKIDPNHFVGWAQEAGVLNDIINVDTNSDDNQSSLVPGATYRLDSAGALVQDGPGHVVALATSATEVTRLYITPAT